MGPGQVARTLFLQGGDFDFKPEQGHCASILTTNCFLSKNKIKKLRTQLIQQPYSYSTPPRKLSFHKKVPCQLSQTNQTSSNSRTQTAILQSRFLTNPLV